MMSGQIFFINFASRPEISGRLLHPFFQLTFLRDEYRRSLKKFRFLNYVFNHAGQQWFHQRKLLTPAFHFGVVDQFYETMSEKADILNQIIEETINANPGKPIDFFELAIGCALDIICGIYL